MATSTSAPRPLRLLLRIPVPWVFVLAYLAGAGLQRLLPLATPAPRDRRALVIAGILLWTLAVTLAGWALALFRRRRTTATPGKVSGASRLSRDPSRGARLWLGEQSGRRKAAKFRRAAVRVGVGSRAGAQR